MDNTNTAPAGKKRFLVTGMAEFYNYVDAETPEEAIKLAKERKDWRRTMCVSMQDFKATEKDQ